MDVHNYVTCVCVDSWIVCVSVASTIPLCLSLSLSLSLLRDLRLPCAHHLLVSCLSPFFFSLGVCCSCLSTCMYVSRVGRYLSFVTEKKKPTPIFGREGDVDSLVWFWFGSFFYKADFFLRRRGRGRGWRIYIHTYTDTDHTYIHTYIHMYRGSL